MHPLYIYCLIPTRLCNYYLKYEGKSECTGVLGEDAMEQYISEECFDNVYEHNPLNL